MFRHRWFAKDLNTARRTSKARRRKHLSWNSSAPRHIEMLESRIMLAIQALSLADPAMYADTAAGDSKLTVEETYVNNDLPTSRGTSSLSDDGRFVVYLSDAINIVAGQVDTNKTGIGPIHGSGMDAFLFDRTTGTTALVS